jgi:polysaccharide export outer membrane protein
MVKTIWAVACAIPVFLAVTLGLAMPASAQDAAGIAGVPRSMTSSMDNSAAVRRPGAASPLAQSDAAYRLGAEDQLRISVWDNKELTLDLVVRPDGKISMPLIQDVVAEGLTAAQLASEIQRKLAAYIVNPEVSVIVLQVNAPKYFLIGNIARPGTYPLRGDTSVLQALALAGGFTQFASPKRIKLIRAAGGRQEVRMINYYDIIEDGGQGNYLLKPGDTIVVP